MADKTDNTVDFYDEITLERLEDLSGYEIADGYDNVVGWKVIADKEFRVGKVRGLIASKELGRILYLDVAVDESLRKAGGVHKHIVVPIGLVRLKEDLEIVQIDSIDADAFIDYPHYDGSDIDVDYERLIHEYYEKHSKVELQPYVGREAADYSEATKYDNKTMYGSRFLRGAEF